MTVLVLIALVVGAVTWCGFTLALTLTVGHPLSLYHQLIGAFLVFGSIFAAIGGTYVATCLWINRRPRKAPRHLGGIGPGYPGEDLAG